MKEIFEASLKVTTNEDNVIVKFSIYGESCVSPEDFTKVVEQFNQLSQLAQLASKTNN